MGEALALKRAGARGVKVFALEGEGGLTPGGVHEGLNSAWGLALDNLFYIVDWNDSGIDDHPVSSVVYGAPQGWFGSHGWRVYVRSSEPVGAGHAGHQAMVLVQPGSGSFGRLVKTRKGRGYLKHDIPSHGAPHKINDELFWETKSEFAESMERSLPTWEVRALGPRRTPAGVRGKPQGGDRRPASRSGTGGLPGQSPGRTGGKRSRGDSKLPAGQGWDPLERRTTL